MGMGWKDIAIAIPVKLSANSALSFRQDPFLSLVELLTLTTATGLHSSFPPRNQPSSSPIPYTGQWEMIGYPPESTRQPLLFSGGSMHRIQVQINQCRHFGLQHCQLLTR